MSETNKEQSQQPPASAQQPPPSEKPKTVKVRIVKDGHEHAGAPVEPGATIEVSEPVAKWLVDNKVGERA